MTSKRIANITILISLIFFGLAFTQKSFCTNQCGDTYLIFLLGWLGILLDFGSILSDILDFFQGQGSHFNLNVGATFTWLANPCIFFALIILKRGSRTAFRLSIISTALILSFMLFDHVIDDEAGHYSKIKSLETGYWLWLASSLTILLGAYILHRRSMAISK